LSIDIVSEVENQNLESKESYKRENALKVYARADYTNFFKIMLNINILSFVILNC